MVNIGILGFSNEGIAFLKFFAKYINQYDIGCDIVKYDVGYDVLREPQKRIQDINKEPYTIQPNRVIIRETKTKKAHTLFAPVGSREHYKVKKEILTISRVANVVIALFSLNQPLKEQFEYFNDVRYFPDSIYLWLMERERLDDNREEIIKNYVSSIKDFFLQRKIKTNRTYQINVEFMFDVLNNHALESIFDIIKEAEERFGGGTGFYQKPIKRSDYSPNILEETGFNFNDFFDESHKYIFLAGAGISRNKPTSLPTAQEIIKYLLLNCAPKGSYDDLKNIQYELLVEYIQRYIDKELIFLDIFEEDHSPNQIHFFLANALINGHEVITTNFDNLLEKALIKIFRDSNPLTINNVKLVITEDDFNQLIKGELLENQSLRHLYKIHGSKQNIFNNQSTPETLITTISSLMKNKDFSNLFEIEQYKKEVLMDLIKDRTLVVMGYSGSDEFDISPLLRLFPQLNNLIWVTHSTEPTPQSYKINPFADPTNAKKLDNKLLVEISNSVWYEVTKLEMNTEVLCKKLWGLFFPDDKIPIISNEVQLDLGSWFSDKYSDIDEFLKYYWVIQLYFDMGKYNNALDIALEGFKLARRMKNKSWENLFFDQICLLYIKLKDFRKVAKILAKELHNISDMENSPSERSSQIFKNLALLESKQGNFNKALSYYTKSLKIDHDRKDFKSISQNYNSIGILYKKKRNYKKALINHQKALIIENEINNLKGEAYTLNNIATVYKFLKLYDKSIRYFQDAFKIYTTFGDIKTIGKILNDLGENFIEVKNYDKALECFQQGLKLADILGKLSIQDKIKSNLRRLEMEYQNQLEIRYERNKDSHFITEEHGNSRLEYNEYVYEYDESSLNYEAQMELFEIRGFERKSNSITFKRRSEYNDLIEIPFGYDDNGLQGFFFVVDYKDEFRRNKLKKFDEKVINDGKISIVFTYPLSKIVKIKYKNKNGFTPMDLFQYIYMSYKKIYDEEERKVGDPGVYKYFPNRKKSYGKYGICNHYITELLIKKVFYSRKTKTVELFVTHK